VSHNNKTAAKCYTKPVQGIAKVSCFTPLYNTL